MPEILIRSTELYVEKLKLTVAQDLDMGAAMRLFPALTEADALAVQNLIRSLIELVPKITAIAVDKDNLPIDRSLVAMAITYLIMPFDILPADQHALLGYLDDALIVHTIAAQLSEPEPDVVEIINTGSGEVASLMTRLPEWFTSAIYQFAAKEKATHYS